MHGVPPVTVLTAAPTPTVPPPQERSEPREAPPVFFVLALWLMHHADRKVGEITAGEVRELYKAMERAAAPVVAPPHLPDKDGLPMSGARAGYVLAMAVLQSPLYAAGDDELRAAVAHFTESVPLEVRLPRPGEAP